MNSTKKQEHTTSLSSGTFVGKSDPRVEFRGRLDSLDASIVEIQILAEREGFAPLAGKLEEVREKVHDVLSCEVTGRSCGDLVLWGLDSDGIRERSHRPEKYLGLGHIRTHRTMGLTAALLNKLRTQVREAELSACRAFGADQEKTERPDIIRALNRLSSAVYILTYACLPEGYDKTITF
jgi:ethanolamine utilization cobalamin adenosyltransferase